MVCNHVPSLWASGIAVPQHDVHNRPVTERPESAPGWDGIDQALSRLHPGVEPVHWGTGNLPNEGVYGVSAFRDSDHWLYVTYGLTELFGSDARKARNRKPSGRGFELTMRTPNRSEQPPTWPVRLLEGLADYVFSTGSVFAATHRFDPGGPITGRDDTLLRAVAFDDDPQLAPIATPNGRVTFLTAFGITDEEYAVMRRTTTMSVLDRIRVTNPLLVTDRRRGETELDLEALWNAGPWWKRWRKARQP
jgi:suppressor of fused